MLKAIFFTLLPLLITGCFLLTPSSDYEYTHSNFCQLIKPITYSLKNDSNATVQQLVEYNKKYEVYCKNSTKETTIKTTCIVFNPLTYSLKNDTNATVNQIQNFNEVYNTYCKGITTTLSLSSL